MSLTELLLQAKAKKSQEILFIVGSEPRAKSPTGWESLRNSPGLMTEWRLLQQSFLDNHQMAQLEGSGLVLGETFLENTRIGFSFFQQGATMKALLDLDLDGAKEDIQLPANVIESCLRMKGLVVLSGPADSGQAASLYKIMQKMGEEKPFFGVVFSSKAFPQVRENKASFVYHTGVFATKEERDCLLAGVDMVVFHHDSDEQSFAEALALAERGIFVIYSMKAPSISNALRRCLAVVKEKFGMHGVSRFSEVFSLAFSQYAMSGLNGERVYAHEVLLVKPQVRELVENENIKGIELLLNSAIENSGLQNLNQALLHHLIRRRVSIKSAFETSRDPDGLDLLLKKVGI